MESTSTIDRLWGILLKPVPLLPEVSFILERPTRRERLKAQIRKRNAVLLKKESPEQDSRVARSTTIVGKLHSGNTTVFGICGHDLKIDAHTWMFGEVKLGAEVTATVVNIDGALFARKIVVSR